MPPILLRTKQKIVSGYAQTYHDAETAAIERMGFEVLNLEASVFGFTNAPDYPLTGRVVFCRHYANESAHYAAYVAKQGGTMVVPNYGDVLYWYKTLPLDFISKEFLGERKMDWYSLAPYGYLEKRGEEKALKALVEQIYGLYANNGKVFVKSETKGGLTAKIYTKSDLLETLYFVLGVGCHRTPRELIVSQPMEIRQLKTDYKSDEYRCLIVDSHVSTISLYTDVQRQRDYTGIRNFANHFATTFATQLPNSYDLDVARLTDGRLAVVELNDIAACGLYADHDMFKFYGDVYALAKKLYTGRAV